MNLSANVWCNRDFLYNTRTTLFPTASGSSHFALRILWRLDLGKEEIPKRQFFLGTAAVIAVALLVRNLSNLQPKG